jgi:thioesterase domain-containing protein
MKVRAPLSSHTDDVGDIARGRELDEESYRMGLRWPEQIWKIVRLAHANYVFKPLPAIGIFFEARDVWLGRMSPSWWGWTGLFTKGLDVLRVPGDHYSMIKHPNVVFLAQSINEVLRRPSPRRSPKRRLKAATAHDDPASSEDASDDREWRIAAK